MIDISVIIPVYNMASYLTKCIDSVLNQKGVTFEIILVDDGSTDTSPAICDEYSAHNEHVKVIHKNNAGLGWARNSGLDIATGNYIFFLDSDDWLPPNTLRTVLSEIKEADADILYFEFFYTNDRNFCDYIQPERNIQIVDNHELMKLFFGDRMSATACSRLYRREQWSNLRFGNEPRNEDAAIAHKVLEHVKKAAITNQKYYVQYCRPNSLEQKKFTKDGFFCTRAGYVYVDFAKEKYPDLVEYARYNLLVRQWYIIQKMVRDGAVKDFKTEYKTLVSEVKHTINTNDFIRDYNPALIKEIKTNINYRMVKIKKLCFFPFRFLKRCLKKILKLLHII